jgi:PHD/YefM family antitoxin component YafN of YafNO toxin-antitoxin module
MEKPMTTVNSAVFQRDPGPYQEAALREPVTITAAGQDRLVLLSAEEYRRLKRVEDIVAGRRKPGSPDEDPLAQIFARLHARIEADDVQPDAVDAELNTYNDENRH